MKRLRRAGWTLGIIPLIADSFEPHDAVDETVLPTAIVPDVADAVSLMLDAPQR